jgi:hypothetical protein
MRRGPDSIMVGDGVRRVRPDNYQYSGHRFRRPAAAVVLKCRIYGHFLRAHADQNIYQYADRGAHEHSIADTDLYQDDHIHFYTDPDANKHIYKCHDKYLYRHADAHRDKHIYPDTDFDAFIYRHDVAHAHAYNNPDLHKYFHADTVPIIYQVHVADIYIH